MCLLSYRKSFISNNPIFAQLRAYLLVFACLFAYQSLFSHSWQMFVQLCALSRKAMRINAHATILVKHKGAEHHSHKRQSRPYYSTPLGASDIKGPSQTVGTLRLSPPNDWSFKSVPNECNGHSFKSVPNECNGNSFKSVPNEWG